MAEVTPKYKTWDEYVRAFQEHGWWQAKDIEPRNWGTYRRYRPARCAHATACGAASIHGRQGIGDWKPGWFTPTMKSRRSEHRHGIALIRPSRSGGFPPPLSRLTARKDGDRIRRYPLIDRHRPSHPVYFHSSIVSCPGAVSARPKAVACRVEITQQTAAEYGIRQGRLGGSKPVRGARSAEVLTCTERREGEDVINLRHTWWYPR